MWMRLNYYNRAGSVETRERILVNLDHVRQVSNHNERGNEAKSKLTFTDGMVLEVTESVDFINASIKGELAGRSDEAAGVIRG